MIAARGIGIRLIVAAVLLAGGAWPAAAEQPPARVRVTGERVTIWRAGFLTPAAFVDRDTVLDVVGRRGNWLEVVLPDPAGETRETGFIAVTQVVALSGSIPAQPRSIQPSGLPIGADPPSAGRRVTSVRAFGDVTLTAFRARDTFNAIFDRPNGLFYGGGAEFRFRDLVFVQAAVRRFRATGERVFVSGSEVFPLGIEDTLTLTPIDVTVGGRHAFGAIAPYGGVGVGRERVQETSAFADADENTDEYVRTYRVVGGVEWHPRGFVAFAGEVVFQHVPDALAGGVADAFGEHNLGGVGVLARVLIGK